MSSQWDSRGLLEPITADSPCGENLEDTPLLASFDAFRVFGQSTPLDPVPDWAEIKRRATEALGRSKDLRLLAHLGSAVLRTDGVAAFAETLSVASRWLDGYWSETYPLVTDDIIFRRNALNCFSDQMAVVDGLRRVPLVSSRQHGTVTLRDIDIAAGLLQPREGETRADEAQIDAAFAAMALEDLSALQASVSAAMLALKSIDSRMRDAAGAEAAPTFDPLSNQLGKLDRLFTRHLAARPGGEAAAEAGPVTAVQSGTSSAAPGAIRSRQDAIRALDAVADFFRQTEPSSPIPLFLARAKRLVAKDFLEVLQDVAPDAVAQARAAGGLREGE